MNVRWHRYPQVEPDENGGPFWIYIARPILMDPLQLTPSYNKITWDASGVVAWADVEWPVPPVSLPEPAREAEPQARAGKS